MWCPIQHHNILVDSLLERSTYYWQWGVKIPYYEYVVVNIFLEVFQDFPYIFGYSYVGCIYVYNGYIFLMDYFLKHSVVSFFVSLYDLCFEIYLVWFKCCLCPFAWNILFHHFTFSLYRSFVLRWLSYRQYICRSCFFIYSATICLLIGALNPFTFKGITDRYILIAIFSLCTYPPDPFIFLKQSLSMSGNAGLVEIHFFSLLLSGKLLILLSILNESLAG